MKSPGKETHPWGLFALRKSPRYGHTLHCWALVMKCMYQTEESLNRQFCTLHEARPGGKHIRNLHLWIQAHTIQALQELSDLMVSSMLMSPVRFPTWRVPLQVDWFSQRSVSCRCQIQRHHSQIQFALQSEGRGAWSLIERSLKQLLRANSMEEPFWSNTRSLEVDRDRLIRSLVECRIWLNSSTSCSYRMYQTFV